MLEEDKQLFYHFYHFYHVWASVTCISAYNAII